MLLGNCLAVLAVLCLIYGQSGVVVGIIGVYILPLLSIVFFVRGFSGALQMKKVLLILTVVFTILTFCGAGYVLYNDGRVNAGYAVIPMVFTLASLMVYRSKKDGKVKVVKGDDGPIAIYCADKDK